MGEYVSYRGDEVKIGTMANLYYVSYDKYTRALEAGELKKEPGNLAPQDYILPENGSRLSFPFPDEDHLPFGRIIEPYDRGVPITVSNDVFPHVEDGSKKYEMEILWQKPIHRESDGKFCLALVWRDPKTKECYRLENIEDAGKLVAQIVLNNIIPEPDPVKQKFYTDIASRIAEGYAIEVVISKKKSEQNNNRTSRTLPRSNPRRRGRGL